MSCTWKALRCAGDRKGSPNQAPARLGDLQTLGHKEKAAFHSNPFTFPLHGCAFLISEISLLLPDGIKVTTVNSAFFFFFLGKHQSVPCQEKQTERFA